VSRAGNLWKEIATAQSLGDGLDENVRMPKRGTKRRSEENVESEFSKRMKRVTADHNLPSLKDLSYRCPRDMASYRLKWVEALRNAHRLQLSVPRLKIPVNLPPLTSVTVNDKELLAQEIAWNIKEEKIDVVYSSIEAFGPEVIVKVYNQTCDVEAAGGMPTVHDHRRRTPGGVFMTLLKEAVPSGQGERMKSIMREDSKVSKRIVQDQKVKSAVSEMRRAAKTVKPRREPTPDPPLSSRAELILSEVNSEKAGVCDRRQDDVEKEGEEGELELDLGLGIANELNLL
jgi:hypothetical protein